MARRRVAGRGSLHWQLTLLLVALATLAAVSGAAAWGEQHQSGKLIVSLDGGVSPLRLPRDRAAPVAVRVSGSARMDDGSLLPRLTKLEIDLPKEGVVSTRGLPFCTAGRLRHTRDREALAACRAALVGHGGLEARVFLPGQAPFTIHARLLVFNGRMSGGRRVMLLHAYAARPPVVAVVPFVMHRRRGRFSTYFVAHLPQALGPWPHVARFSMTLSRRYVYRGRQRSFLSASCPVPPRFTAGFLSLARVTYSLAGGVSDSVEMIRGCRAR